MLIWSYVERCLPLLACVVRTPKRWPLIGLVVARHLRLRLFLRILAHACPMLNVPKLLGSRDVVPRDVVPGAKTDDERVFAE